MFSNAPTLSLIGRSGDMSTGSLVREVSFSLDTSAQLWQRCDVRSQPFWQSQFFLAEGDLKTVGLEFWAIYTHNIRLFLDRNPQVVRRSIIEKHQTVIAIYLRESLHPRRQYFPLCETGGDESAPIRWVRVVKKSVNLWWTATPVTGVQYTRKDTANSPILFRLLVPGTVQRIKKPNICERWLCPIEREARRRFWLEEEGTEERLRPFTSSDEERKSRFTAISTKRKESKKGLYCHKKGWKRSQCKQNILFCALPPREREVNVSYVQCSALLLSGVGGNPPSPFSF